MQAEFIDYIRFGVISPEEIKRISVAKLVVPDTYNEDGYPIDGGLVDQRLGVIDPGLKCKTCGGRAKTCPGHFGHIDLVRPVIHPEYAKIIYLLLQSTCYKCNRILLNDDQIKEIKPVVSDLIVKDEELSETTTEHELEGMDLLKRIKAIKRCPHCGAEQPKIKLERPTFFYMNGERLKPDEILNWLSKISNDDLKLLGIDPAITRPEWFVLTALLVPPVNVRPSITLESGERSEDDLTHKLVDIMRINQRLEQDIDAGAPQIIIDDLWELLQYQVTTYFNNETPGVPVARHRSTRPLKTLVQRLKGKEGRLRYNLSGKRVNFSARTVIVSDPNLTIDQIGVPRKIAENLTIPINLTQWNIDEAKKYLESTEYPTVLNVITKEGIRKRVTDTNREELLKEIQPGYILERQLIDGDIVLMNRQPTLHRISIMAHNIKVLPGKVIRIHVSAAYPYNADYDGDEMNLHVPQAIEARAEAKYLMQPRDLILSPRDGRPIMFIEEDEISGLYYLTKEDSYYTKEEAARMLSDIGVFELPKQEKNGLYSGREIFSLILPKDLNFENSSKGGHVVIKNGRLIEGGIGKSEVGEGNGKLILKIFAEYGPTAAKDFLFNMAKLTLRAGYTAGITISVKDYYMSEAVNKAKEAMVSEINTKVLNLYSKYKEGKMEPLPGYTKKETLELEVMAQLEEARSLSNNILNKYLDNTNNAKLMVTVGARGNMLHLVSTSMLLGQQAVRGRRTTRGYAGRVLPFFRKNSKNPEEKGFIVSSFFSGLKPAELFMHAMGARDSAVVKYVAITQSGYLQRRLINAMQDFYIDENLAVKDASNALIETVYGGDGVDPTKELIEKEEKE
ncbi:MAG: DNA-directed RNA polymerase subunit A' [Candidatus Micrarchaeia archaeon]